MITWYLVTTLGLCSGRMVRHDYAIDFPVEQCPRLTVESCRDAYLEIAGEEIEIEDCSRIGGYWVLEIDNY